MFWIPVAHAQEAPAEEVVVTSIITETESAVNARFFVPAPLERVDALIQDLDRYPEAMPPITAASMVAPGVVHLTISLPWPMAARDSVSRVDRQEQGETVVFTWVPAEGGPPPEDGVVRLHASRGSWRLEPQGAGTLVTYESYNTVPANVPTPILKTIHRIEGNRLARNFRDALGGG